MNMVKHKRDNPDTLTAKRDDELKALANKTDDEIDYSDIPATDDAQWSRWGTRSPAKRSASRGDKSR